MKNQTAKRTLAALLCAMLLLSSLSVAAFAAGKKSLAKATVAVVSAVSYTGKAQKPAVTVKVGKTTLKKGTDYTLTYANNKKIGVASVTVTAKKNSAYTGAKTVKFKIVPAKVKGLTAVKLTKTAAKLTWKAVKGADGYAVYTYNKSAKTYTRVKVVKGTSATVKNLKASTTYRFAVRAYTKVGTKNFWGAYSALLKAKTAANKANGNRIDKYKKAFLNGTYLMTFTTNDKELGNQPITVAAKNGNVSIDTTLGTIRARMIQQSKSGKTYLLIPSLKKYTELTEEMLGDESLDLSEMTKGFAQELSQPVKQSTVKMNGKTYNCESTKNSDGTQARYYFDGDKLVQIDTINPDGSVESVYISKFTTDVPDSLFTIPKGYGYLNLDWLMSMS